MLFSKISPIDSPPVGTQLKQVDDDGQCASMEQRGVSERERGQGTTGLARFDEVSAEN